MLKVKSWIWLVLAVITVVVRFIYGRKYEIQNGEFHISNGGLILTFFGVVFFLLFVFTQARKSKD
ncbi:MAG: hypothetical protein ACKO5L_08330 [Bacteroidota bacterium]